VGFLDGELLVGDVAWNNAPKNPTNTVVDCKRMFGRKVDDLAAEKKRWKFALATKDGKAAVQVNHKGQDTVMSAEQIGGHIIANLKQTAESYVHAGVKNAVRLRGSQYPAPRTIVSPSLVERWPARCRAGDDCTGAFRRCTARCTRRGSRACWNYVSAPRPSQRGVPARRADGPSCAACRVLRVISEPVAAAIAYDLDQPDPVAPACTFAVFNIGSRSCEVVVMGVSGGVFTHLGSAVDHSFGGDCIDDALLKWAAEQFKKKHKMDPSESARSMARLRVGCERAKKQLTLVASTKVEVESAHEGIDFSAALSRAKFDELTAAVTARTSTVVAAALQDAKAPNPPHPNPQPVPPPPIPRRA